MNKQNKKTRNILSGLKNKGSNTISFLNLPFNKLILKSNKTQNENVLKFNIKNRINKNLKKYNSNKLTNRIYPINDLIESKNCHLVAVFKDYLISDYIDEFLRRFYSKKEIKERLPKFESYYKNYLTFFCKPTFSDFFANDIIQSYGEAQAEIYYNLTYGKKKKKEKITKEIAKTILNTLIRESIDGINNNSKEKNYNIKISNDNTILLNNEDSIFLNGNNKISNENSIYSILHCFSCENINEYNKKDYKKINPNSIKKIKKIKNISLNSKKNTIDSNKSPLNKFNSNITTSERLYTKIEIKDRKNNLKNSKENSFSQNNLSNRTKNKSKDFSNSKNLQMSNSNFSKNYFKIPVNKNSGILLKNNNNKIYLTSNSPISSQRIRMKNSSNKNNLKTESNNNNANNKKNLLKKNSDKIDLKDIMKLTLQVCDYKTKNIKNINNTNNNLNNNYNNNLKHFHTLSSPTINNFNININNHICLNNNNNLNYNKSKKLSFQGKNINSRNKEQNLYKMNTDLEHNKINYSPNFQNYATNTTNDLDSIMKNKLFLSLNGSNNDKIIRETYGLKSNRFFHNSHIKNIYQKKDKVFPPQIRISSKGYYANINLKNHINQRKMENKISPLKTQK